MADDCKAGLTVFLFALVGFMCGLALINWWRANLMSQCAIGGRCCSDMGVDVRSPKVKVVKKTEMARNDRKDDFIFVGIMTTKKYVDNRGLASFRTWAGSISGHVMFFSSEGSVSEEGVPVVGLPGVDDHYPPQKKSFMMLKYMHDNFLDKYEWFVRADDDVFIKGDKLDSFLRGINSSRPWFIGQTGTGKADEVGKLGLADQENFCMGGPGMIFSRETLRRVAPHVGHCLQHLYTPHEDVEVGRCVGKFAGVQCTWSYQMQQILHQNYKEADGSFKNTLKTRQVHQAATLHPVKDPSCQYRIFTYLQSLKIRRERQREVQLHREVADMAILAKDNTSVIQSFLSKHPSLVKFQPTSSQEAISWQFVSRTIYSQFHSNPRRALEDSVRGTLDELVNQMLLLVNKNAHLRDRTLDYKGTRYWYMRLDPVHGPDYSLDFTLTYKRNNGRPMTTDVRKHVYLQRNFLPAEFKEAYNDTDNNASTFVMKIRSAFWTLAGSLVSSATREKRTEHIDIIMPLVGRFTIFRRFMKNFENVLLKPQTNARLILVLHKSADDLQAHDQTLLLVRNYQNMYGVERLEVLQADSEFSRGPSIHLGVGRCRSDSLLLFIDVDILFSSGSLERVRLNTVEGFQVYFPIVFSQYDPEAACQPNSAQCECSQSECVLKEEDLSHDTGYWRQFGFGIAAMYRNDYEKVGGFDLTIRGWGKEDVDLYTKFINQNYRVFRAVDTGMVHIFHAIQCNPSLEEAQLTMCLNSKTQSYASTSQLADQIYSNPEILNATS